MPKLGIGASMTSSGLITPGIVTDNLVLKHKYDAGSVIPVSDGAAFFDGSDSEIVTPLSASVFDNDFTITAWVKMSENHNSYRTIVGARDGNDDLIEFYIISNSSGSVPNHISLAMGVTTGTHWNTSSEKVLAEDGWTHVACTFTPGEQKIYKNGASTGFQTGGNRTSSAFDVDAPVIIGNMQENSSHDFRGYICNVGVWTSVLTQSQIKSIMNKNYAGLTDSEKTNLVSWWNLDASYSSSDGDTNVVFDNHHSGGESLGSEMVIDGSFNNNATSWTTDTSNDSVVSISNNAATITNSGTTGYGSIQQASTDFVDGNYYKLTFDVTALTTSDSVTVYNYNSNLTKTLESITTPVTITDYFLASNTDGVDIRAICSNGESITIDNISVKQVNGNTGTLS